MGFEGGVKRVKGPHGCHRHGVQHGVNHFPEAQVAAQEDLDRGLVDWLADREGRRVLLCWLQGEPTVAWWHELAAGFAGRQAVVDDEWE